MSADPVVEAVLRPRRLPHSRRDAFSAWLPAAAWLLELCFIVHPAPALQWCAVTCFCAFAPLAVLRSSAHVRTLFMVVVGAAAALAFWCRARRACCSTACGTRWCSAPSSRQSSCCALPSSTAPPFSGCALAFAVSTTRSASTGRSTVRTCWGPSSTSARWRCWRLQLLASDATPAMRLSVAASSVRGVGVAVMWSPFKRVLSFVCHLVPSVRLTQAGTQRRGPRPHRLRAVSAHVHARTGISPHVPERAQTASAGDTDAGHRDRHPRGYAVSRRSAGRRSSSSSCRSSACCIFW